MEIWGEDSTQVLICESSFSGLKLGVLVASQENFSTNVFFTHAVKSS